MKPGTGTTRKCPHDKKYTTHSEGEKPVTITFKKVRRNTQTTKKANNNIHNIRE
jgi:hypothetical protein